MNLCGACFGPVGSIPNHRCVKFAKNPYPCGCKCTPADAIQNQDTATQPPAEPGESESGIMAQRVEVRITSDLSGDEGAATHLFGIDGNTYEIDLTEKEAAKLRTFLTTYVEKGRKVRQGGRATARRSGSNGTGPNPRDVRAWAKAQKIAVPERGRIPGAVIEQFEKAQG